MRNRLLNIFALLIYGSFAVAQISSGGFPNINSKERDFLLTYANNVMQPIPQYAKSINQNVHRDVAPLRFAHPIFVNLSTDNSGYWTNIKDGYNTWFLAITSHDAYSINLVFDRLNLIEGATLYIYNEDMSEVLGAFTKKNNIKDNVFATSPLSGETIIVELNEPENRKESSDILIGAVNHDFLDINRYLKAGENQFKNSHSCHPNYSCEENEVIKRVGKSVCRIIIDGTSLCSGTLINNSNNDGKPYILTAAHCFDNVGESPATLFTFNYEVPNCESNIEGNFKNSLSGATIKSFAYNLDALLLEMNDIPPLSYQPIWAGWNINSTINSSVFSLHHPEGDVKKIAKSDNAPVKTTFMSQRFVADSHWDVEQWNEGFTEGGSSGAGLFDENGSLIGILSGGNSVSCSNAKHDYFVRFEKAWDYYEDKSKQLKDWLDPENSKNTNLENFSLYDEDLQRLSNFSFADNAELHKIETSQGSGYWTGNNSFSFLSVAELFGKFQQANLHGLWIVPGYVNGNSGSLSVNLWTGWDKPKKKIKTLSPIQIQSLKAKREYFYEIKNPIELHNNIWVEIGLENSQFFALYGSKEMSKRDNNTFWIKNSSGEWMLGDNYLNFNSSLWIDLLVSGVVMTDTFVDNVYLYEERFLYPNPLNSVDEVLNIFIKNQQGSGKVLFYNSVGQKVDEQICTFNNGKSTVKAPFNHNGLLIVSVYTNDYNYNFKLEIR